MFGIESEMYSLVAQNPGVPVKRQKMVPPGAVKVTESPKSRRKM
jgi:hypothetical protein